MTHRLSCHRPTPSRGMRPSIAAAAAVAGALIWAMPARAALVVTSDTRSVVVQTNFGLGPVFENAVNTGGVFDESVVTQVTSGPANGALVSATQNTVINPLDFSGSGQASMVLKDGVAGFAESRMTLLFTLTSSFSFSGNALLSASGNDDSHASFDLDALDLADGNILSGSESAALLPFSGTLGPGHYRLSLSALSTGFNADESGDAAFNFNLAFVDLGDPLAAVPEPQTLALAFFGLLACAGAGRRR